MSLDAKRSGDIYTREERALLTALAARVGARLERLDGEAMLREAKAHEETLQRYVPSAVTEGLRAGESPPEGEREVTVLFVDIRGYSGFAEPKGVAEIHAMVDSYSDAVSVVVRRHEGVVVEFAGDGLMAVFGAHAEHAEKERAAVLTAFEILDAVGTIETGGAPLAVGVGVATGSAYVGDVRGADRRFWGVVGNTTTLAARLQTLTRDLDAAVAIDEPTRERCGSLCSGFELRESVALRGLRRRLSVWTLPLPKAR